MARISRPKCTCFLTRAQRAAGEKAPPCPIHYTYHCKFCGCEIRTAATPDEFLGTCGKLECLSKLNKERRKENC